MFFTERPSFLGLSAVEKAIALNCNGWESKILNAACRIAQAMVDGTLSVDATTDTDVFAAFPDWEGDPMWSETENALGAIREIDDFHVYETGKSFGEREIWMFSEYHFETAGITCEAFWEAIHPLTIRERAELFVRATKPSVAA